MGVHEGGAPSGGPWGTYTLSMYVPPLFSHIHPPLIVCVFSFFRVFVIHPHARDVDDVRDVDRSRGRSIGRSVDTGVWFLFRARVVHAYIAHSARVWGGGADARGCPDVRSTDRPIWVGRSVVRPSVRPSVGTRPTRMRDVGSGRRRACAPSSSKSVVESRIHRRRSHTSDVRRRRKCIVHTVRRRRRRRRRHNARARTRLRVMSRYSRKTADGVRLARRRSFTVVTVVVSRVRRSPSTVVVTPRRRRSPSSSSFTVVVGTDDR